MSTAAKPADATVTEIVPVKSGRKKLIIIIVAVVLLLALAGGGAAVYLMAQQHDAAAEADEDGEVAEVEEPKKKEPKRTPPVFLPLEMFTVNLADREAERYAQVGVTLELGDSGTSDKLKAYMPAIRNDILMLLAHKKSSELQERAGKLTLAREIRRVALKPLSTDGAEANLRDDDDAPVRAVHFSSFIIQ